MESPIKQKQLWEKCIEEFGGYEKCKEILSMTNINFIMNDQALREHMLKHRRQHNIFEVGDKVVSKQDRNLVKTVIIISDGLARLKCNQFDHVYPLFNFRHATDKEIAQGYRDE